MNIGVSYGNGLLLMDLLSRFKYVDKIEKRGRKKEHIILTGTLNPNPELQADESDLENNSQSDIEKNYLYIKYNLYNMYSYSDNSLRFMKMLHDCSCT